MEELTITSKDLIDALETNDGFDAFKKLIDEQNARLPENARKIFWKTLSAQREFLFTLKLDEPELDLEDILDLDWKIDLLLANGTVEKQEKEEEKKCAILAHLACKIGDKYLNAMQYLVQNGGITYLNASWKDEYTNIPLHNAALVGNIAAVKWLLHLGVTNTSNNIPFYTGDVNIARILLVDLLHKENTHHTRECIKNPAMRNLINAQNCLVQATDILKNIDSYPDAVLNVTELLRESKTYDPEFLKLVIENMEKSQIKQCYLSAKPAERQLISSLFMLRRRRDTLIATLPKPLVANIACRETESLLLIIKLGKEVLAESAPRINL